MYGRPAFGLFTVSHSYQLRALDLSRHQTALSTPPPCTFSLSHSPVYIQFTMHCNPQPTMPLESSARCVSPPPPIRLAPRSRALAQAPEQHSSSVFVPIPTNDTTVTDETRMQTPVQPMIALPEQPPPPPALPSLCFADDGWIPPHLCFPSFE